MVTIAVICPTARKAAVVVATLALIACQGAHSRPLELDGGGPDADSDDLVDASPDVRQPEVVCAEPRLLDLAWSHEEQVVAVFLDKLPVGVYLLSGSSMGPGGESATIWILDGEDLDVLGRFELPHEKWITAMYNDRESEILAIASHDDVVTSYQLAIIGDWGIDVESSRQVCSECSPSSEPPVPGPRRVAFATQQLASDEVTLHLAPEAVDEPIITSEPLAGASPVVQSGSFGPLVFYESGDSILVAQGHWDGELAQDGALIPGGPFVSGFAMVGAIGGFVVTAVTGGTPSALALVSVDGSGQRTGYSEIPDVGTTARLAVSSNDISLLAAWIDTYAEGRPNERAASLVVLPHHSLTPAAGPLMLGQPFESSSDRASAIVATSDRRSHTVLWTESPGTGAAHLSAAIIECNEE